MPFVRPPSQLSFGAYCATNELSSRACRRRVAGVCLYLAAPAALCCQFAGGGSSRHAMQSLTHSLTPPCFLPLPCISGMFLAQCSLTEDAAAAAIDPADRLRLSVGPEVRRRGRTAATARTRYPGHSDECRRLLQQLKSCLHPTQGTQESTQHTQLTQRPKRKDKSGSKCLVVFFGFPESCSDLLRSRPGLFRNDSKKECH